MTGLPLPAFARAAARGSLDNARRASSTLRLAVRDRRALEPALVGDACGTLYRLTETACLAELAARETGRLAYLARRDTPDVVVVNYVLHGRSLLIRSGVGPKLQAAERGDRMVLQIDDIDPGTRSGWSVTATGPARRLTSWEQNDLAPHLTPDPWADGPRPFVIRLQITHLSGRRLDGRPVDTIAGSRPEAGSAC